MREPAAQLHKPTTALRRLQSLAGEAKHISWNDRGPNRQAQLTDCLEEAFDVAFAALNGGPLPPERDRSKAT